MNQNKRKGDGYTSEQPAKKSFNNDKRNTNNRMIQETRIFLNKSNSKWIVIGINPEEKIFDIDVWLGGDKCTPFKLGENGLTDLICMLAGHTYFKDEYWVSVIMYLIVCLFMYLIVYVFFLVFLIRNSAAVCRHRQKIP